MKVNVPFLEILKEVPSYLKFLRGLLSETGALEKVPVAGIGEVCSIALQRNSLSKLRDPGSFSIPCSIGDIPIERALYDVSLPVQEIEAARPEIHNHIYSVRILLHQATCRHPGRYPSSSG